MKMGQQTHICQFILGELVTLVPEWERSGHFSPWT